jgi:pimeloyl-ACP methyl ester carboxylesterase/DNA-binding CsgD family transcriptional regulator
MFQPRVSYARADDGAAIAYSTVGDGPISIVLAAPLFGQLEIAWEEPTFAGFVSRLAVGTTIILFDRRGSGLSDHVDDSAEQLGLPHLARDVKAVLDAVGVQQAVVLGASIGGLTAMQFAADNAERTSALVVIGSCARVTRARDYDIGMQIDDVDVWTERMIAGWGTGVTVETDGPTMAGNDRYRQWAARLERHTLSPGRLVMTLRALLSYDVRPILRRITAPTCILHRRDDQAVSIAHGQYLADHIPGAQLMEMPGSEHSYFLGDQDSLLGAIREFIDENVSGASLHTAVRRAERKSSHGTGWAALTTGEQSVAALVAQGLTNAAIADRIRVSPFTVDGRLRRIFAKLGISSRVELTAQYARLHPQR